MTDRQQRERDFYDEYWLRYQEHAHVNLDPVMGKESRPWNSYWCVFEAAKRHYDKGARTLLDFGCGGGVTAVMFATLGYEVTAFDVSPQSIETAKRLADAYGVLERTHFSVQVAENLDYPDNSFDVVVGVDILHHVEIAAAVTECLRVLKPGGVAYFREAVEVPLFDRLRNTAAVRFFFPNEKILESSIHITEDERKMNSEDIAVIGKLCPSLIERRFYIFARLDRLVHGSGGRFLSMVEKFDYWLGRKMPSLNQYGGSVVLELHKDQSR